jgi:hypothetical protein
VAILAWLVLPWGQAESVSGRQPDTSSSRGERAPGPVVGTTEPLSLELKVSWLPRCRSPPLPGFGRVSH